MLMFEFTATKTSLNNILKGVIINSSKESINKPCRDIITSDLLKFKPQVLIHCYSLKEFISSLKFLQKTDFKIVAAKEIIPNDFDIGLVRDLLIENVSDENLLATKFAKRFRYYSILMSKAVNKCYILTFNPEISTQKQLCIELDSKVVKCTTLQTLEKNLCDRELKSVKEIKTDVGSYEIYTVSEEVEPIGDM